MLRWGCLSLALCFSKLTVGQVDEPYILNGSAVQQTCNCYTLTPDAPFTVGSMWNKNKIDLKQSFNYNFNINLGCRDVDGADGLVFVLQPIGTSIGSAGEGIGYEGVAPSVGIAIDTYQNIEKGDPPGDNITIHKNGIMRHSVADDLDGPVPALTTDGNIEDCGWHFFRIIWEADSKTLIAEIDGVPRVKAQIDLVRDIFGGDPLVYWGFTAATGGQTNKQVVCTSLNAAFGFAPGQKSCFPNPIQFVDQSKSFGTILNWFWDFGDGTSSNSPSPQHTYPRPGSYDVKLAFVGNNGCISDTVLKTIIIGSKPVAKFGYNPSVICESADVRLLDSSFVEFGSINDWNWTVGDKKYTEKNPRAVRLLGTNTISLTVHTIQGCVSDEVSQTVTTKPSPVIDFAFNDVCVNETPSFVASDISNNTNINGWAWDFGDGATAQTSATTLSHQYKSGGTFPVTLTATADNGCSSVPVTKPINIIETHAFAGNDTIAARNQPLQLHASGGDIYSWSPSTGLDQSDVQDPVATLQHNTKFILTASTAAGCATTDTLDIKVYDGPELYVPSAFSPNDDGRNDRFTFIAVGMRSIDLFQVYNRYGQLLYSSTDMQQGWDGRIAGVAQAAGTYVWVIKGVDYTGKQHLKKGTVTLVR